MIDKNELIKLLPKLIREDDEIKGAIITALSGVVATKEDIARLIELSNRRFEAMDKRFEAMDKRFEAMDKRFEDARKHRENIEESMIIIRGTVGEVLENMATKVDIESVNKELENTATKVDIENANKEILDYLKKQFKDE